MYPCAQRQENEVKWLLQIAHSHKYEVFVSAMDWQPAQGKTGIDFGFAAALNG